MLSLLAAQAATIAPQAADAIQWADLGMEPGIQLGPFLLRYYSLAYLSGILLGYWHLSRMIKAPGAPMAQRHADDLFFYCTLGIILGGRLGYAMFYDPSLFVRFDGDGFVSWNLLRLWDGGMSFHGGVLGVLVAIGWVCNRGKLSFLRICDYIAVTVPFGMFFGRLANFVNGELWGRPTDVPWAMVFPGGGDVARHPSQLYQAGLEGLLLIIVLLVMFWQTKARFRPGLLVATFTVGMGLARFTNEFFREPDSQLTWLVEQTGLSMGQWLSIPLALAGVVVMVIALRRKPLATGSVKTPA